MQAQQLTERQREIVDRLEKGIGAREIGQQLGVSRNAVYQQIGKLRRMGVLDPDPNFRKGPSQETPATFAENVEQFVARSRARLDSITQEEEDHRKALDQLAAERVQIEDVIQRMEGTVITST
jgi:transposase